MVFTLKDLLVEAAQDNGPLEDYATVWRAIMRCAEDVLQSGRGISIPHFAKISIIKNSVREAPGLKGKVFLLSENFQRTHSAVHKKPGLGLLAPCVDLNVAKLCMATQLDKDSVQQMMATLFQTLGRAIGKGQGVRVTFGRIGVLGAEDHRVYFTFFNNDEAAAPLAGGERGLTPVSKSLSKLTLEEAKRKTSARCTHSARSSARPRPDGPAPARLSNNEIIRKLSFQQQASSSSSTPQSNNSGRRGSSSGSQGNNRGATTVAQLSAPATPQQQAAPPPPAPSTPPRTPLSCFSSSSDLGSPDVRHLPGGVDVDLNIKPTSIFPSFRNLAAPGSTKALKDSAAHHRALEVAYHRLEQKITKEKEAERRQRDRIKERLESLEAKQVQDNMEKKRKQAEWRAYLMKQAEDLRQRRDEEHKQLFSSPAAGVLTAYPQTGQYDRSKRSERERVIKESLDEQVKAKEQQKAMMRKQELDHDQLLIDWVKLADQQERNNKLAKKILERESLFREWDMQRQHLEDVKAMGPTKIV